MSQNFKLLFAGTNPNGRYLESILEDLIHDIELKNSAIEGLEDASSCIYRTCNVELLKLLRAALEVQEDAIRMGNEVSDKFTCVDVGGNEHIAWKMTYQQYLKFTGTDESSEDIYSMDGDSSDGYYLATDIGLPTQKFSWAPKDLFEKLYRAK